MTSSPAAHLTDELLRRFAAAIRSRQLYAKEHPIISRNLESLSGVVQLLHQGRPSIVVGLVSDEIIVDEVPVSKAAGFDQLVRRLRQSDVERITIERGVTVAELASFVEHLAEGQGEGSRPPSPELAHIRVGRIDGDRQAPEDSTSKMGALKRLYADAVSVAQTVWEAARMDAQPDPTLARAMIDGLAQAVAQNRTALLALTTLKNYDNYTFTHMVNVSILTMGQARALGVDGPLLREFGLAALMHDIGKVRTPLEILHKPGQLSDAEFAIMRRHTIDGAEILRATPDIPTLAPVVAFEHHLRLDGSNLCVDLRRALYGPAT